MIRYLTALWVPICFSIYSFIVFIIAFFSSNWIVFLFSFVAIIGFVLDYIGRSREYFYLMKHYNKKHSKRFWDTFRGSRCGREVMISIDPDACRYYHSLGYRWYHIIPDDPTRFLTKEFWRNLAISQKI